MAKKVYNSEDNTILSTLNVAKNVIETLKDIDEENYKKIGSNLYLMETINDKIDKEDKEVVLAGIKEISKRIEKNSEQILEKQKQESDKKNIDAYQNVNMVLNLCLHVLHDLEHHELFDKKAIQNSIEDKKQEAVVENSIDNKSALCSPLFFNENYKVIERYFKNFVEKNGGVYFQNDNNKTHFKTYIKDKIIVYMDISRYSPYIKIETDHDIQCELYFNELNKIYSEEKKTTTEKVLQEIQQKLDNASLLLNFLQENKMI